MSVLLSILIPKEVLDELLRQKLSAAKIGAKLGCSDSTVLYWEKKHGLSPAFEGHPKARGGRSLEEIAESPKRKPTEHRRRLKARAIEYKGGRCILCGYDKCNAALEFHHLEKVTKSFGLSGKGVFRSWQSIMKELDKCVLICANCHREVETGVQTIPNGS